MDHEGHEHHAASATSRLRFAILATGSVFFLEVVGGLLTHSLALLADSAHVFMDVFALSLALGASRLSQRPSSEVRTFGWHRAEVLAAFINGCLLFGVSVVIFREAYYRILTPREVLAPGMLAVGFVGLVVNAVVAFRLHVRGEHDINIRGAYVHVLGDMIASVGVVVGAIIIYFSGWTRVDAALSIGIGLLIAYNAIRVVLDALHILLEGVPKGLDVHEVANALEGIQGVNAVHDLHIWTVCSHILSLSCHMRLGLSDRERRARIIEKANELLQERFRIRHSTIQVDEGECTEERIAQDLKH